MRYTLLLLAATSGFANSAWQSHGNNDQKKTPCSSTLAYPTASQWHMGIDITQGLSDYTVREIYTRDTSQGFTDPIYTLAYRLASKQFFGYGRAFFVEMREALNIGFVDSAVVEHTTFPLKRNHLLNTDVALGTYFLLSRCLRMTMRPVVGFEYHNLRMEGVVNKYNPDNRLVYKLQFWGPFAGIGFGIAPTKRWSLTSRFAFHFPQGKHSFIIDTEQQLNARRHGLSLTLDSNYQIKENMAWNVAFEHRQLAAYGFGAPGQTYFDLAHVKQTSVTSGLRFSF